MTSNLNCPKCGHQLSLWDIHDPLKCPSCGAELETRGNGRFAAIDVLLQFVFGLVAIGCFASGNAAGYTLGAVTVVGWLWLTFSLAKKVISVHAKGTKGESTAI